jgi:hypothetical protein
MPGTQSRRQILSVDEPYREKALKLDLPDVEETAGIRMRDLACDPDFGVKALAMDEIFREGFGQTSTPRGWPGLVSSALYPIPMLPPPSFSIVR